MFLFLKAASSVNSLNGDGGKKRPIADCEESPNKKVKINDDNKVSSVYVENNQQRWIKEHYCIVTSNYHKVLKVRK